MLGLRAKLPPCVIDVEASGLGRGSYPIEIGFVLATGKAHCTLVKPVLGWDFWCPDAERLHGISRLLLDTKGQEIVWVANWLNKYLQGLTVYSDAWVNDMCWLGKLFEEVNLCQLFRVESILTLLAEDEKERWNSARLEVISASRMKRHRASADAKIIQQTYQKVKQEFARKQDYFDRPNDLAVDE